MPMPWILWFSLQGLDFLFSTFSKQSVLYMIFEILSFFKFFVVRIMNFKNFHCVSFLRSIFFIPESATFNPFFTLIPATSKFSLFGFGPKKQKNSSRILKVSVTDFLLCYHLCLQYIINYDHKCLKL